MNNNRHPDHRESVKKIVEYLIPCSHLSAEVLSDRTGVDLTTTKTILESPVFFVAGFQVVNGKRVVTYDIKAQGHGVDMSDDRRYAPNGHKLMPDELDSLERRCTL